MLAYIIKNSYLCKAIEKQGKFSKGPARRNEF